MNKKEKSYRILDILLKLKEGKPVNSQDLKIDYGVDRRTIQRDMREIKNFFIQKNIEVDFNRKKQTYELSNKIGSLLKKKILGLVKVLLESRAFNKEETKSIIENLLELVDVKDRKEIEDIICNEFGNYIPPCHNTNLLEFIWELTEYIRNQSKIKIKYGKMDGGKGEKKGIPVSILFSEFYFYIIIREEITNRDIILRVDRIKEVIDLKEKVFINYSERFQDIEYRKKIQFMFGGKEIKLKFEFNGASIEAVKDKIPTAKIKEIGERKYSVEADVFYSRGLLMWILTQGKYIKVTYPNEVIKELKDEIFELNKIYK